MLATTLNQNINCTKKTTFKVLSFYTNELKSYLKSYSIKLTREITAKTRDLSK